jgi:hypothetical protein
LLPSVAQPPLPLQEFLPLQPLSPLLHPPLPLQEFWPLQACFSLGALLSSGLSCDAENDDFAVLNSVEACIGALVPASRPANAALAIRALVVFVMVFLPSSRICNAHRSSVRRQPGIAVEKPTAAETREPMKIEPVKARESKWPKRDSLV